MLAALGVTPAAARPAPPHLNVRAATLKTTAGVSLYAAHQRAERRVASTIKMLNALVVRDKVKNLDEVIKVHRKAAAIDNGGVGLRTGQRITIRQLLNIMLVRSANDAAEALAIHIGGTEKRYVALMNAKAKKLGLKHTTATDPHGLYKHEHSSAEDLSIIARRILADPVLRKIVRQGKVRVPRGGGKYSTYSSTNRLLGHYRGIEGVKTGFTNPAGYCFVGAAKRGGVELVGVVLGAGSVSERFSEMRKLLDWGFAHTHVRQLVSKETTVGLSAVGEGAQPTIVAHPYKTVSMALLDGSTKVTRRVVPKPPALPVKAGVRVGTMELLQGSTILAKVPLLAVTDVSIPATPTPAALAARSIPASPPTAAAGGSNVVEEVITAVVNALR